ncbi:MAG: hypothetical protein ABF876_06925 [Acetobacter aceti]|uniref:Uncharacterized protein n=1 Tax=Acetobacter aceti TaxID=435 RepID=A0A1U9KFX7_ACEAC|nr:hypothetical protein [Acetobacter aceti]AQS84639.1 hypothetical protein A0U92_07435 [Acetobacter aceti]
MTLPIMGMIMFPLCLLLWSRPDRLLQLILIGGIFPAAAALILGGLCIQPSLVPGLAFLSYVSLQKMLGARYPGQKEVMYLSAPMIFNGAWAVFGSLVMPRLFHNEVLVWPQKADAAGVQVLLAPSFGNISQDGYLVVNIILMIFGAQYLTRPLIDMRKFYGAFVLAGWLVVFIAFWQFASRMAGVPFPKEFFYSNTAWTVLDGQMAGPVPRINGSFTEPSACATYLAGVMFSCIWLTIKGYTFPTIKPLIIASTLGLCLTTSTTGFVTVAIGMILLPFMVVATGAGRLLGRLAQFAMIGAVVVGVSGLMVVTFAPQVVAGVQRVSEGTASKKDSASYKERTQADTDAMAACMGTYGLGTGWGSNRSSSLVPGLLASVGIIGCVALLMFDIRLMLAAKAALNAAPGGDYSLVIEGFIAAILGRLIAALTSAPTIGMPDFYVMIAITIAAIARVRMMTRQPMAKVASSIALAT